MDNTRAFPPGIHVPSLTFFEPEGRQDIDWATQDKHVTYIVQSGVQGIVVGGTCGEAATLTVDEKHQLITQAKRLAADHGKTNFSVTAGCSGSCTREVIDQTHAALKSGADFALVLPPGSFAFAIDQQAIISFFNEVADNSPLPIIIYNFPSIVNGLNLSSETLETLGAHSNICAVKLTCGGIAKAATVAAKSSPSSFGAVAGQGDWLLPALSVGGIGCIGGVANIFPKALMEVRRLFTEGDMSSALELQRKLSIAERGFADGGLHGTKWIVAKERQYPETSAHCRRPIPRFTDEKKREYITKLVSEMMVVERQLEQRTLAA
ncbi:dihydrodipicolinate synthetase [Mariannaea sp. PMI_226]|nr:dihydrodipicolinate synthetase [Mariannaea sp. PMI_226]